MKFWTDLQGIQLSEETNLQWVHALGIGNYKHPAFGELDFTPDRLQRFADSVNNKVRGIDPDIDYDHKLDPSKGNAAAGWAKKAEVRGDGLWLLVEWTDKAKKALKDKEYRYFSTEFAKEWANAKGEKLQDVILGGGLTNRPFLKDLVPVNLSELYDDDDSDNKENKMDRAELISALGLSEDATDEDIKTKLSELQKGPEVDLSKLDVKVNDEGKIVVSHPDSESNFEAEVPTAEGKENEGTEAELAKLAEDNPALATILTEHNQMKEDFKAMQTTARLSEVTTQLSDLSDKKALPPVASDKFRDVMVQLPKQLSDKLADGLKELLKVGVVELGERTPSSRDGKPPANDDAIAVFLNEVDKVKDEEKITTSEATTIVMNKNRQMYNDYIYAVESGQRLVEEEA